MILENTSHNVDDDSYSLSVVFQVTWSGCRSSGCPEPVLPRPRTASRVSPWEYSTLLVPSFCWQEGCSWVVCSCSLNISILSSSGGSYGNGTDVAAAVSCLWYVLKMKAYFFKIYLFILVDLFFFQLYLFLSEMF